MGEIKSVKVDNWGVFFLQKLQNFFNKTDYCDLTLQFRDNSQLKVHRLVLSACTDYFNVLEQTCEVIDDAIIMPNGLQADVVVPIVNFMYTGTLEFELKMYNRLLRTAKDMNMTVLLKLLEAHRRTMEMHPQKTSAPSSPKSRRKTGVQSAANLPVNTAGRSLIQANQNKRIVVGSNVNANLPQQRNVTSSNTLSRLTPAGQLPVRQIGSTTFTRIKIENEQETYTPTAGHTLLKQLPQQQQHYQQQQATPTSPFEQLRKGYNNNKRPAVSTFVSPPAKKPNLEDVKEFAEQQRMRKQIAAEYGDDDYDASNIMDDDNIHNDDDDDEVAGGGGQTQQTSATSASAGVQTVAQQPSSQQQQQEDPPGTTTIIVKHEGPDKPPTIVVKDNSNSKMNHAKIISEVLRQYPHLVRSNKNIKLKIMPNAGGQAQKIIVKKEPSEAEKPVEKTITSPATVKFTNTTPKLVDSQPLKTLAKTIVANRPKTLLQSEILPTVKSNSGTLASTNKSTAATGISTTTAAATTAAAAAAATTPAHPQKRRIDSKTMHALIALGAENTTGPWLCLRCGRNGHPISIPSYRGFRRHLINTHKEIIDPALCEHCGYRSASKRELHFHMQIEHKVKTNLYIFPECELCHQMCIDSNGLNQHLIDSHPDENKQQCIYCNKIFPEEIQLYTHMKTFHKKQALEDGIIDYSDDEVQAEPLPPLPPMVDDHEEMEHEQHQLEEQLLQKQQEKKINILSDISLPIASSIIKTDSFITESGNQQESTTSAVSEEYLQEQDHSETKFVAADGSEVILTAEQRKEILSQLNQEHEGGSSVVMVLNENQQFASGETQSEQSGAISHDETSQTTTASNEEHEDEEQEDEDQHDDNQIYKEMKSLTSNLEDDSTSQTETPAEAEAEAPQHEEPLHEEEPEPEQAEDEEETEQEPQERPEHLDESKESIDNLEWAENLISEHDLADEVSQTTAETSEQSNKPDEKEEEIKEDDNKSQDEISKTLKAITGDWSEDDDEDMPEEEPLPSISPLKEMVEEKSKAIADVEQTEKEEKEAEKQEEEQEENKEFEDKVQLLASLQATDNKEDDKNKETSDNKVEDTENIDEDDIDMALKSLHKETEDEEEEEEEEEMKTNEVERKEEKEQPLNKDTEEKDEKAQIATTTKVDKLEDLAEDVAEEIADNDIKKEKVAADEIIKVTKAEEEKCVKEKLETIDKPETSSIMEVDEETKKDLIDSLLSGQAETMEDTAIETPTTTATKIEKDVATAAAETADTTSEPIEDNLELAAEDEFLDITPEKKTIDEKPSPTTTTTTTTSASATTTEVPEISSTEAKDKISSEERVKSLISEWGDDEDEDDNDTDLTANL